MRPLTVAALVLCLVRPAAAEVKTCVMAPLNPLGIETQDARKVQRWLTAAMSGVPGHRFLISTRIQRLLYGPRPCDGDAACLAAAGRRVGAELVVAGDVGSLSGAYMVYLRLVGRDGTVVRSVNGVLDPRGRGLRNATRELAVRLLVPDSYTGAIDVKVDMANAWIYLDGQRVARSSAGLLDRVAVGTHALRVTHQAYRDYVRFVKVDFNQTATVEVKLSAFPIGTGEMRLVGQGPPRPLTDSELPWYRRWWAVAAFGAVVMAATTTTVALLVNRSVSVDSEVSVRP